MTDEIKTLSDAQSELLTYVKDEYREEAINAISDMLTAQMRSDVEQVELCIPTKSVDRTVDLGYCKLCETTQGVLFSLKGGLFTLIDRRQTALCQMLISFMDDIEKNFENIEDPESRGFMEDYVSSWLYVLQAPIFCTLDPIVPIKCATTMLEGFNKKVKESDGAELQPEDPVKDGIFLNAMESVEETINGPKAPAVKTTRKRKKK